MLICAKHNAAYRWRLIIMTLLIFVFGLWFLYDGYILYPHESNIAREYKRFQVEHKIEQWPAYARKKNWPVGTLGQPGQEHSFWDMRLQKVLGILSIPFALGYLVMLIKTSKQWIQCDAQGLTTSGGLHIAYQDITALNKDRWVNKGIAIVHYEQNSRDGHLVLDDRKFAPEAIEQIVKMINKQLAEDS